MKEKMTLHDLYIHELQDMYSAESQITKALPKVIRGVSSEKLITALQDHLEETRRQREMLDTLFQSHNEKPTGEHCEGIEGLLKEGDEAIEKIAKGPVRDAALIAGCQKVEHYEISGYGTLKTLAMLLGYKQDVKILEQIQSQESNADELLTKIAETEVNENAAEVASPVLAGSRGGK